MKFQTNTPIIVILLASLILLSVSPSCVLKKTIADEFVDCLTQTNAEVMDKVNSELDSIDQNLYTTEEKLLKLEQVILLALEWIENQKVKLLEEYKYGSWHSRVTHEGLAEFKNDQYEIAALELSIYEIGTPNQEFYQVIRVTDLSTNMQSDWEQIENELEWRKSTLEQRRQEILDAGKLSTSTLLSVVEHLGEWDIQAIGSATYNISGPGLGMAGELTTGKWAYYRISKEIIPIDTQSEALQKILTGGF